MSQARRGGRWGLNFISASGPQSSISMTSLQATEAAVRALQERSESSEVDNKAPKMVISQGGRNAYAPPPSLVASPLLMGRAKFAPGHSLNMPPNPSGASRAFSNLGKRRMQDDDDYFNDDEGTDNLEYQPAPGSPAGHADGHEKGSDSDASDDPLDAFMENIEKEVKKIDASDSKAKKAQKKEDQRGVRDDIEQEDEMEAYLRFMEENPNVGLLADEDEIYEYDSEGNIIATEKKPIDPLPPVDHSTFNYAKFVKNFYVEHPDISQLSESGVADLLEKLNIRLSGVSPPRPICAFAHLNLDDALLEAIRQAGFTAPTPIQATAVPAALAGRDIVGIAKTGSGKTAAFLWPLITHIMAQPELKLGDGPIGVICAPTRELAIQIYSEAKKLTKIYNLTLVCAYGGGSLWEQQKACEAGCELLVCTPGRLIDLVKKKSTNLRRTTFIVFDEADKMFNLGFEPQVRSIANHVRPDRQALLFSATFKSRIERLARDILVDPVRIVQGEVGEANEDITQIVEVFERNDDKWNWLAQNLVKLTSEGSVLIFVTRKAHSDELAQKLKGRDFKTLLIHGDMHQSERNSVIQAFKHQEAPILVATDVASRGLDIPSIHNVVNYEVARDIDTHTHRIGRTGRAGVKGTAYTLFVANRDPPDFAAHLVRHLEMANQPVPARLLEISLRCPGFADNRGCLGSDSNPRAGIGFVPRSKRDGSVTEVSTPTPMIATPININPTSLGPAAVAASPSYQTDRISAMKAAFTSQYSRRFVSAGVEASRYTHPELLGQPGQTRIGIITKPFSQPDVDLCPPPLPTEVKSPPAAVRKRSRWD